MPRSRRNRNGAQDPYKLYRGYNFTPNDNIVDDNSPRVFFTVHLFQCPCNDPKFSLWESPLDDADQGEYCKNERCRGNPLIMPFTSIRGTTPCQSPNDRAFGSFQCHRCSRQWYTAHSWANCYQKCEVCQIKIYPYDQDNLAKPRKNLQKKHQMALCGKCVSSGVDCSTRLGGLAGPRRGRSRRRRNRNRNNNNGNNGPPQNPFNLNALGAALPNI